MNDQIEVSTVSCATQTETTNYPVVEMLETIRTGGKNLRGQVEQIRNRYETELAITGDSKKAKGAIDALKKQLPGVTWSGTFSKRASDALVEHSGLLCADLDGLNGSLSDARRKLLSSPFAWAVFTSPSGDGLKVIFRVSKDAAKHTESFRAVEQHVIELTGVQIDESCKDVARLCFLSHDSELYHNANAIAIEPLPEPQRPARSLSNGVVDLSGRQRIATELLGEVNWETDTSGFVVCPGKDRHTAGNGLKDCKVYLDGPPSLHCVHNSCRMVVDAMEYALRSQIGKAEWKPSPKISNSREGTASFGDGDAIELLPAPEPYVPPPLTLLPAAVREYVQAAAAALNQDVSFILLPLLSSLGSAIGNARSIQLKRGFIQPPVIWTGIIGRSGQGKSPAINDGCFALMEHERELMRQNKDASAAYDEELATWEGKTRDKRGVKPVPPTSLTCLMDDMTLEALAETIQQNPRGVLVKKDELSHWLASFDQYHAGKGSDVSRWLSLHTAMFFGIDRRTDHRRYRIPNPRVCITGGIQPRVLARALTEDFFERGLPARFLFAAPPSRQDKWSEDTIPDRIRDDMLELFDKLWLLQPEHDGNDNLQPMLLTLEPDAKREFVAYYNECGASAVDGDERTEAAWNKLSGYAARLALIGQLAANPNATTVTGEVMKDACDLARWFGAEAVRIYASMAETTEQREMRKLAEFIRSHGSLVSVRDVTHYHWPFRNQTDKAEQALNALVKKQLGAWLDIKPEGRGRPTRKFQLLQASPSPKIPELRGKPPNYGDGEALGSQKNGESWQPIEGAEERLIEEAKRLFNAEEVAA
jgi:hypothetical protein